MDLSPETSPFDDAGAGWWAVALSQEVKADKPLGVICDDQPVVLFRDGGGVVRALEDRCPHRRAPLSLGRIKDGALQCGYHGWTFEGVGGQCVAIPNLQPDERVPARYRAETWAVVERDGFVHVRPGAAGGEPAAAPSGPAAGATFTGATTVSMSHDAYVAAMLDGPELLFEISGLRLTGYILADHGAGAGHSLRCERGALPANRWANLRYSELASLLWRNHRYLQEWPFTVAISVSAPQGVTQVELRDGVEAPVLSATIAPSPAGRGATSVRWRGEVAASARGRLGSALRRSALAGRAPLRCFDHVDGAGLSGLLVGPSRVWTRSPPATTESAHRSDR